jgi:TfoX/Sxy family transcriptional regulator of competence genes
MTHHPKSLKAILQTAAPPDLELAFRPMFGGIMAYALGKPFASLSDVGLALKFSGAEREALLAVEGACALRYAPDMPPSKSYVVVPDAMLANRDELRAWTVRSVAGLAPGKGRAAKAR